LREFGDESQVVIGSGASEALPADTQFGELVVHGVPPFIHNDLRKGLLDEEKEENNEEKGLHRSKKSFKKERQQRKKNDKKRVKRDKLSAKKDSVRVIKPSRKQDP
jgi:hypothetical protein